jgi:hypothetical protein
MLNLNVRQTDSAMKGLKHPWSNFLEELRKIIKATFRKQSSSTNHYNSNFRTYNIFRNFFILNEPFDSHSWSVRDVTKRLSVLVLFRILLFVYSSSDVRRGTTRVWIIIHIPTAQKRLPKRSLLQALSALNGPSLMMFI